MQILGHQETGKPEPGAQSKVSVTWPANNVNWNAARKKRQWLPFGKRMRMSPPNDHGAWQFCGRIRINSVWAECTCHWNRRYVSG